MMRLKLSVILMSFLSSICHSQWSNTTIEDFINQIKLSESVMSSKGHYSYSSKYSFFESFDSQQAKLEFDGMLISDNSDNIYLEQYGQIVIQNKDINIQIDSSYKQIIIQKAIPGYFKHKTSEEFEVLSNSDCVVMKKDVEGIKKYSLEFPSGGKYLGCELWFDKMDYLTKYILYASQEIDNSQDFYTAEYIQPKLEISFFDFRFGQQVNLSELKRIKDFVIERDKVFVPVSIYQEYEVIDLRIENN